MKFRFLILLILCFCVILNGCSSSGTRRVDVDDETEAQDAGISSKDMRTMARKMAEDILKCPQIKERIKRKKDPAKIIFIGMVNKTRDYDFDDQQILIKIRQFLIKNSRGYITFLASQRLNEKYIEALQQGEGEISKVLKDNPNLYKADYVLTGRAYTKQQMSKDAVSQYHAYTFWLVHVPTKVIVWQNDYETKKVSDFGGYGRQ